MQNFLLAFGFRKSLANASLFIYAQNGIIAYFLVYVDDIVLMGNKSDFLDAFVHKWANQFSIKDFGSSHQFLSVEVISTPSCLFLSQHWHIADLLDWFNMAGAKEVATLLSSSATYSLVDGSSQVDATSYSRPVGYNI